MQRRISRLLKRPLPRHVHNRRPRYNNHGRHHTHPPAGITVQDRARSLSMTEELPRKVRQLVGAMVVHLVVLLSALVGACVRIEHLFVILHRVKKVTEQSMDLGSPQGSQDGAGIAQGEHLGLPSQRRTFRQRHRGGASIAEMSSDASHEKCVLAKHGGHRSVKGSGREGRPEGSPVKLVLAADGGAFLIDPVSIIVICTTVDDFAIHSLSARVTQRAQQLVGCGITVVSICGTRSILALVIRAILWSNFGVFPAEQTSDEKRKYPQSVALLTSREVAWFSYSLKRYLQAYTQQHTAKVREKEEHQSPMPPQRLPLVLSTCRPWSGSGGRK